MLEAQLSARAVTAERLQDVNPAGIPGQATSRFPGVLLDLDEHQKTLSFKSELPRVPLASGEADHRADNARENVHLLSAAAGEARDRQRAEEANQEPGDGTERHGKTGALVEVGGEASQHGSVVRDHASPVVEVGHNAAAGRGAPFLERWHAALALSCAAEHQAIADERLSSKDPKNWAHTEPEVDRANHWRDLAARITLDVGERDPETPRPHFQARDVELCRWFRIVQLRSRTRGRRERATREAQLDSLFKALYVALIPLERGKIIGVVTP